MFEPLNTRDNAKVALSLANIFIYEMVFLTVIMTCYVNYFFYYSNGYVVFFGLYLILFILFSKLFSASNLGDSTTTDLFLSNSLTLLFSNFIIYIVLCLVTLRILPVWPFILMQVIDMLISAFLLKKENRFIRSVYPPINLIAVYGEEHYDLIGKLNNTRDLSMNIVKVIDINDFDYDNFKEIIGEADGIATIDVHHDHKKRLFKLCYENHLRVYDVPSITDMLLASSNILHLVDTPILMVNKFGPTQVERFFKRAIDIVGSLVLLVPVSPILLLTALAIKIEDKGDIFYKQKRLTIDNKEFEIIKFRSMIMNAESKTGVVLAKENDNRITKVGKFIRKCRIDELPQLLNILKGDMSFVGPRPERPEIYDEICKSMPEFRYRLVAKAGLTGYAQIYGKYNTSLRDKLLLDLYYIENYSLIDDIKLIILTFKVVFIPESTEGVK